MLQPLKVSKSAPELIHAATREPEIGVALRELDEALTDLSGRLESLYNRVEPVLNAGTPAPSKEYGERGNSKIGEIIFASVNRVSEMAERVTDMWNRLEV